MTTSTAAPSSTTPTGAALLHPRGPFSLDQTRTFVGEWPPLAQYAPRPEEPLRIGLVLDGHHDPVAVSLTQERPDGPVAVEVGGTAERDAAAGQVARMLSLDHDASTYPDLGRRDPAFGRLMDRRRGLRPTLFGSPYEAACWAVIASRVPVARAVGLRDALAAAHGDVVTVAGAPVTCFPGPATLLGLDAVPGLPEEKLRRLHGVAEATLEGRLEAETLRALGPDGARTEIQRLRGIGPFWATLVWLRACGVVDEFPDEPRARGTLARLHGRDPADDLDDLVEVLRPFRTWAAHLLRVAG